MKVLIVKLSSMGDVICALPALTDAKKAMTEISCDWVVEEHFAEIPNWHSAVDTIIPIALRRWRQQIFHFSTACEMQNFWKKLTARKYDYIIDAQGLIKSAVVTKIARGISCGFNLSSAREPLAAYLYQKKFGIPKSWHAIERMRRLFALVLGYTTPTSPPHYGIIKEKLSQNTTSPEKYLFFAHGASRENKCWQLHKWIELTRLVKSSNIKVKLPWGNSQELSHAQHIAAVNNNVEVLPKLTISEIASILIKAQGAVTVDTGFSHLATALDVPTISLYGPTDPKLGGTYGKNQHHLINMQTIEPQIVWQKIKTLFNL
jgi:heptosyltransferase-1